MYRLIIQKIFMICMRAGCLGSKKKKVEMDTKKPVAKLNGGVAKKWG
jgi:hypothetical protein